MTATAATPTVKRPTTCGGMYVTDETLGSKGCKRLPRHSGDHRAFLTASAERKANRPVKAVKAPKRAVKGRKAFSPTVIVRDIRTVVGQPRGRLNAANRRLALATLAEFVDNGRLTASEALGLVVKF